MSDDFENVFGARAPARPTFADRVVACEPAADATGSREVHAGSSPYKPYGYMPAGVGEVCDVQRWIAGTEIAEGLEFQYRFLMQVGYVGEEQLRLFLPDCIVVIEGRRLRDLRKRLVRRTVTFIQQFNLRVWSPLPEGEVVIDLVEIVRSNGR